MQIYLLIIPYFICNLYKITFIILRNFVIKDSFKVKIFYILPLYDYAFILQFFFNFTCILPILSNYLCFYFVIRDTYIPSIKKIDDLNISADYVKVSTLVENKDIDDYLN